MELNTKVFSVALSSLTISSASAFYSYINSTSDKQKEVVSPIEKSASKHRAGTYEYCMDTIQNNNNKRVCG